MKSFILNLAPPFLLGVYRNLKRRLKDFRNRNKTTEENFTEIYAANKWGGKKGELVSGGGTRDQLIATAYVDRIRELAQALNFQGTRFVDLGCGDFRIGSELVPLSGHYTGADIALPVIEHHQKRYASERVAFVHLNMISDPLPDGEVCFIRQVFQHLSNSQIAEILPKLAQYKYVFITEHLPSDEAEAIPNLDKVHGEEIRLYQNSGIYLTKAPFLIEERKISTVLELRGHGFNFYKDPGVIRTLLYQPSA